MASKSFYEVAMSGKRGHINWLASTQVAVAMKQKGAVNGSTGNAGCKRHAAKVTN